MEEEDLVPPTHDEYCKVDHEHIGYVWGVWLFRVHTCCGCDYVEGVWPVLMDPLFDLCNFLNAYVLGNRDGFAIQTTDKKVKKNTLTIHTPQL